MVYPILNNCEQDHNFEPLIILVFCLHASKIGLKKPFACKKSE